MNGPTNQRVRAGRPELVGLVDPSKSAQCAFSALNQMQSYDSEVQAAAAGLMFLAVCRRLRLHPGTVLATAGNVLERTEQDVVELRALRQYMQEELLE